MQSKKQFDTHRTKQKSIRGSTFPSNQVKLGVTRIPLADPRYQPTRLAFPLILPRRRILAVFVLADADAGLGNWVAPSETNVATRTVLRVGLARG